MSRSFSEILNGVDDNLNALSGLGNRFSSVWHYISDDKSGTPAHVRDLNTNGFLAHNTVFQPEYFIRAFDEPTYLTFRIEFNFDDEMRNAAYNNATLNYGTALFPTMYDFMPEPFLQDSSTFFLPSGQTGTVFGKRYCTEYYLDYVLGDHGRAKLLHKFKQALRDIQDNFPYYFESIEGLNTLNSIDTKKGKRLNDCVLTIKCYEGLDLKITQLLQMARKIMWDDMYQRWVLPDMMRFFSMKIFVSEIRLFHEMRPTNNLSRHTPTVYDFRDAEMRNATTLPGESAMNRIMRTTNNILDAANTIADRFFSGSGFENFLDSATDVVNTAESAIGTFTSAYVLMCANAISRVMPTICFDCHMCEFDITDTFSQISSLKSHNDEQQMQEIKIKVGQVQDYQTYPLDINLIALNGQFEIPGRMNTETGIADASTYIDRTTYAVMPAGQFTMDPSGNNNVITGSTVMADPAFDKQLSNYKNGSGDASYTDNANSRDLQEKYRVQRINEYDSNVQHAFNDIGFFTQSPDPNGGFRDDTPRNGIYNKRLAGALENILNVAEADGHRDANYLLMYKRDDINSFSSIATLLTSGMSVIDKALDNSMTLSNFSKATGVTQENLQGELPDIYASAVALKNMYSSLQNSDVLGSLASNKENSEQFKKEIVDNVYLSMLQDLGNDPSTSNSGIGMLSKILLGELYPSMATSHERT